MSEIFKRLKALEKKRRNSVKPKLPHQGAQLEHRDSEVQDLQNEEDHSLIATPEADEEAFDQESSELKGQLEEFRSRLQVLSQEVITREKRLMEVSAFFGKGTALQGKIIFKGILDVDGKYDGEILSGDALVIGDTADVNARINVNRLIVNGKLRGNITANNRIEIHPSGQIRGDIQTASLIISEGAIFEGNCKMEKTEISPDGKVSPPKAKENETGEIEGNKTRFFRTANGQGNNHREKADGED